MGPLAVVLLELLPLQEGKWLPEAIQGSIPALPEERVIQMLTNISLVSMGYSYYGYYNLVIIFKKISPLESQSLEIDFTSLP